MPGRSLKPPQLLYAQQLRGGGTWFFSEHDPRDVHDNGQPIYVYVLTELVPAQVGNGGVIGATG